MTTKKLLIIGKVPPPIGGVTTHVERLLSRLTSFKFPFTFRALSLRSLFSILLELRTCDVIHLHSSNVYIQLLISIISAFTNAKLIVTFHGDLNRYGIVKAQIVKLVIKLCDYPVVLNDMSYKLSNKLNRNSILMSAFIPPQSDSQLAQKIVSQIEKLKAHSKLVFATNAYDVSFDKNKIEIYGIVDLVQFFIKNNEYGLVISDPSGNYSLYLKNQGINISNNIVIINYPHPYFEILKLVDASIRNTSTDGDSLSVKESLYLNKITFVTDVVSRPIGAINYKRGEYSIFLDINLYTKDKNTNINLDGSNDLIELYKTI